MTQTIINVPAAGAFDPTDIEITDGVDDAFLIKDTSGDEWFKIDTRPGTGSDCINMAYTSGQRVLIGKPASAGQGPYSPFQVINGNLDSQAVRIYGSANYDTTNQLTWGGPSNQPAMIHPYGLLFRSSASTGTFQFQDSSNADMFALDDDSNATFTLEDTSGAVFKVVDDNSSPRTYISVTEAGATQFGNAVGTNLINGSTVTTVSGSISFRNASSSQLAAFYNNYFIQNGGSGFRGQSVYGAPTTTTATGSTTIANKLLKQGTTFFYDSSGSGTATITVQYKTDGSFYEDGTSLTERFVMLHNKDASQSVTYKFEPVTNEGSDAPALGTTDTVADDLLDGTGVILAAGKTAIFKVVTYAISSTHSDHKHFWTTIAKD